MIGTNQGATNFPPGGVNSWPSIPSITGNSGFTQTLSLISIPSLAPGTVPFANNVCSIVSGILSSMLLLRGTPQFLRTFSLCSCLS